MQGDFRVQARHGELTIAVVLALIAAYITWAALRMPLGTAAAPGPGLLPAALGALLLLTSLGLIVRAALQRGDLASAALRLGHRNIWITLAALAVLALAFEPAGYLVSATLFMLVLLRAFSPLDWPRSVVVALAAALLSWFFFDTLLGVALPRGVLALFG
jgi:putative tricarboxylic transport membrane protein